MSKIESDKCLSCLGSGQVSSERGLASCPDCDGTGRLGSEFRQSEQRLRQIEARYANHEGESALDIRWLSGELRRYRDALMSVMTAAQDGSFDDSRDVDGKAARELLHNIQFEANSVLGVYSPRKDE